MFLFHPQWAFQFPVFLRSQASPIIQQVMWYTKMESTQLSFISKFPPWSHTKFFLSFALEIRCVLTSLHIEPFSCLDPTSPGPFRPLLPQFFPLPSTFNLAHSPGSSSFTFKPAQKWELLFQRSSSLCVLSYFFFLKILNVFIVSSTTHSLLCLLSSTSYYPTASVLPKGISPAFPRLSKPVVLLRHSLHVLCFVARLHSYFLAGMQGPWSQGLLLLTFYHPKPKHTLWP